MLTWDGVVELLRKSSPPGLTNQQIAKLLGADTQRVSSLTLIMCEANVLKRESATAAASPTVWRYSVR